MLRWRLGSAKFKSSSEDHACGQCLFAIHYSPTSDRCRSSHPIPSVVGEKEAANKSVNVRSRENQQLGEFSLADLTAKLANLKNTYSPVNEL